MKFNRLITMFLVLMAQLTFAQKPFKYNTKNQEIGIHLGTVNYMGDLAYKSKTPIINELNPNAFRFAAGIFYRYNFTKFSSLRASFNIGHLYGNDAETNRDPHRINRNLNFQSVIIDANLIMEWNMAPYYAGDMKRFMTPFFGVGAGVLYFNPTTKINGKTVYLQKLGTEGQGIIPDKEKYSLFNFCIPIVFGVKANITKKLSLGLEIQYKKTFTDYLDDVSSENYVSDLTFQNNYDSETAALVSSLAYRVIDKDFSPRDIDQRGNPKFDDNYFFMFLSMSYNFNKSKKYGCYFKGTF